jgi:hypothetical protein
MLLWRSASNKKEAEKALKWDRAELEVVKVLRSIATLLKYQPINTYR